MTDAPRDAYFDDLMIRYLDDQLQADELQEFSAMLAADPRRCAELSRLAYEAQLIQAAVQEGGWGRASGEPPDQVGEALGARLGSAQDTLAMPYRWARPAAAVLFFVIVGVVGLFALRRPAEREAARAPREVAQLTARTNCTWSEGRQFALGAFLPAGQLQLLTGMAEITFASGAAVMLEGPATLNLIDANRSSLTAGRAVAKVPVQAIGFTLDTPQTTIVDLGTEFGVAVSEQGSMVQVYDGKVIAHPAGDGAEQFEMCAGEAAEFGSHAAARPRNLAFRSERFLREMPPAAERGGDAEIPYNVSRHDTSHVLPAAGPVVIDGDLADWNLSHSVGLQCAPPYGESYHFQGDLMYDAAGLYLAARVGDPRPLRNAMPLEAEPTNQNLSWKGGSVQLWLSTDRNLSWPLEGESPKYFASPRPDQPNPQDTSDRLISLCMWYFQPEQRSCLLRAYGMDRHELTMAEDGWQGVFLPWPDGQGYTMEYFIPWKLLRADQDPPRGGDALAAIWMVHWSDETGRIWKGHAIEGQRPGQTGPVFMNARSWGRAVYHSPTP